MFWLKKEKKKGAVTEAPLWKLKPDVKAQPHKPNTSL